MLRFAGTTYEKHVPRLQAVRIEIEIFYIYILFFKQKSSAQHLAFPYIKLGTEIMRNYTDLNWFGISSINRSLIIYIYIYIDIM